MSESESFPSWFDAEFTFGHGNSRGYFGRDVLRGLVSGIDEFHKMERGFRSLGPAMLGAFMWLDDQDLIQRIADFPAACVVITKQPRDRYQQARLSKLKPLLDRGAGFPAEALPGLSDLAFRDDGQVPVIGPSHHSEVQLPAVRTLGYRRSGGRLVPILHTKMVLLGELWWHDEDPVGGVTHVVGYTPQRLWLGSANGTTSSRRNLELGLWLNDPKLLDEAKRFLTNVLSHSEGLDPEADVPEPDLVEPDYDDEAFAEAIAGLVEDDEDVY